MCRENSVWWAEYAIAEEMSRLRIANKNLRAENKAIIDELISARKYADDLFIRMSEPVGVEND